MKPIVALVVAVALSACASDPKPITTRSQLESEFSAPADETLVIIYRNKSIVGMLYSPHLYVDGRHIVRFKNGRYATAIVESGSVRLWSLDSREHRRVRKAIASHPEDDPNDVLSGTPEGLDLDSRSASRNLEVEAGNVYYLRWELRYYGFGFTLTTEQEALEDLVFLKPSR